MSAVLPQRVREAIEEEFGSSPGEFWKATHDAEVLLTEYHLSPEQWTEDAFRRMAGAKGWMPSTQNHRWYIFRRLLRRLDKPPSDWSSSVRGTVPPGRTSGEPTKAASPESTAGEEPEPAAGEPTTEWFWEGNVQQALIAHLMRDGWRIEAQADTASGQHGVDVVARKCEIMLLIEVKGYPSTAYVRGERAGQPKPTKPSLQAHHWFSGALTTTILRKGDYPTAQLAMAFPEALTYSSLSARAAWALEVLNIWVYLVGKDGRVRLLRPSAADNPGVDASSWSTNGAGKAFLRLMTAMARLFQTRRSTRYGEPYHR
jgi:hypothetical protein